MCKLKFVKILHGVINQIIKPPFVMLTIYCVGQEIEQDTEGWFVSAPQSLGHQL